MDPPVPNHLISSCHKNTLENHCCAEVTRKSRMEGTLTDMASDSLCNSINEIIPKLGVQSREKTIPTREINGFIDHILFSKTDVAEVLSTLPNGYNLSALLKNLFDDILCRVFWHASNKHCLAAWRSFPCGRTRKI